MQIMNFIHQAQIKHFVNVQCFQTLLQLLVEKELTSSWEDPSVNHDRGLEEDTGSTFLGSGKEIPSEE